MWVLPVCMHTWRSKKIHLCLLQAIVEMGKVKLKVRLILYNKGNILLLRQRKRTGGNYTLVGGSVGEDEFAAKALIRETLEEAGIELREEDLQLAHVLHKPTRAGGHRITLYFKATRWQGVLKTGEPDKFKGVSWFALDALPANLSPTVRHVLKKYRDGVLYSEYHPRRRSLVSEKKVAK